MGKQWKQWETIFSWAPKSLQMVTAAMKLKDTCSLEEKLYDQPRQHIKKQRHYFVSKDPSSQSYGFSSGHVWMWELDYKESWTPKNWCFCTVVLEKTLESPLDCKEIETVHPKGNQSWSFTGRTDAKAETPILLPPDRRNWFFGKDLMLRKIEVRRRNRQSMRQLDGITDLLDLNLNKFRQLVKDRDALRTSVHGGSKESDTTELLNSASISQSPMWSLASDHQECYLYIW